MLRLPFLGLTTKFIDLQNQFLVGKLSSNQFPQKNHLKIKFLGGYALQLNFLS
jgi:hypothetical protein